MTTTIGSPGTWTVEKLQSLSNHEAVELFKSLPAAAFGEVEGEYRGLLIHHDDEGVKKRHANTMFNENTDFGWWLGKAFTRRSETEGEGYNVCRKPGRRIVRHLRFGTVMGVSYVDGRPSFMIYYAGFKNGSGERDLTDEVRKVGPDLYLCVATTRAEDGSRTPPGAFIIAGPAEPWVGVDDEALERK